MRSRTRLPRLSAIRSLLVSPAAHDVAALGAGALLALAFAPFDLWPLAVLAPALLFRLWTECRRGRAFWRGWLFGVGLWGAGVYWVYFSLHHFGAAVGPLAGFLTAGFVLALALLPAVLGALVTGRPIEARGATWFLLVLPGAWVLLEWVRSWLLTGFPWLLLGTSQVDTWLAGYGPVVGVYGIGLVLAVTAGALALLPELRKRAWVPVLAVPVVLWGVGAALGGAAWSRPGGLPFDAALVQGNVAQEQKFGTLDESLALYQRLTREVAGTAELVVWPETAVPTFYRRVADRLNEFERGMEASGTRVVTGVFTVEENSGRYYNAVRPLGVGALEYRKQRLVPFGEYMPMRGALQFLERYIQIPMSDIAAGRAGQPALKPGDFRLGASVCYEAAYPSVMRRIAARSTVLINVSNDGWFGDSTAPHQHLQIARMRSIETARPMLRATNTGVTAIIDHQGGVVARGPQFEEAVVQGRIEPRAGLTPYARAGNAPIVVLAALLALAPWLVRLWRRRR